MKDLIFLTEPRVFTSIDNTTYIIYGISGKINNTYEVVIGSNDKIFFELKFWTLKNDEYIEKDIISASLNKVYDVPGLGIVPIISGFFSNDKETIYNMANIICGYYGYTLLPFIDQTNLNTTI